MMSRIASPSVIRVLLFQPIAGANVEDSRREKYHRNGNENDVKHKRDSSVLFSGPTPSPEYSESQNLTRIAMLMRFSIFFRSGVHSPKAPQPVAG